MRMPARTLARTSAQAAAVLAIAVTLSSCGKTTDTTSKAGPSTSASASAPAGPTAAPATGVMVKGTGYTYRLPQGWQDITADLKKAQPGIDSGGRSTPATPPFTANLNVLTSSSDIKGDPTKAQLDTLATQLKKEVVQVAPEMTSKPDTALDGATTLHQEGKATSGTSKYFLVQYYTVRSSASYSLTFAFPRSATEADRTTVAEAVIASFTFT